MPAIKCRYCQHQPFPDWKSLAQHIAGEKKGHRGGKKWAAKLLTNVDRLNQKRDKPERIPMTEEQKEAKKESIGELSGESRSVLTVCPKCQKVNYKSLPVEYTQSPRAWRATNGTLIIMCQRCKGGR